MLYFTVGLCSLECECPTETCFQTNRPLTEEEGSFVRHKRRDCSTQCECVCVCVCCGCVSLCVCEKEIMCVSLRKRVCMSVRKRLCLCVCVCEGLFNTASGVHVYVCVEALTQRGKTGQVFLSRFQSDINRQGVYACVCVCVHVFSICVHECVCVCVLCENGSKAAQTQDSTLDSSHGE